MRSACTVVLLAWLSSLAAAQPGPQTPYPAPGDPQSYPPQPPVGYYGGPYSQPPPPVQLTLDERLLLQEGLIPTGAYVGGGLTATFFGFGIGQAIQGRWDDTGWIFTLGEGGSVALMVYGWAKAWDCSDTYGNDDQRCQDRGVTLFFGGLLALSGFRIWEIVDAWVAPPRHNARVRELRARIGYPTYPKVTPMPVPTRDGDGGVAGVSFRF